ncbi:MAG: GNAT family N-acetyltransferase, partial [Nocardioidaceae bacterium]
SHRQLLTAPIYAWAFGRRLSVAGSLQQAYAQVHPTDPHWYLGTIGVDPASQGQGHAAALLRSQLRRVDEQSMPSYLESTKISNVDLYEHFGFTVTGTAPLPEGAPRTTTMWRPARSR